jgi:hypothetical protein
MKLIPLMHCSGNLTVEYTLHNPIQKGLQKDQEAKQRPLKIENSY